MNKKRIIEALEVIIEALKEEEIVSVPTVNAEEPKAEVSTTVANEVLGIEDLKKMKYNDFKKYASQLGVDCKGTRDEIMSRVVAKLGGTTEEPSNIVPFPTKEVAEEPTEDEFDVQAREIAEDTDVTDIIEALAEVDVKATKKNAIEKLAYALREGLIELEDEDEDEDEDVEVIEDVEVVGEDDSEDEEEEYEDDDEEVEEDSDEEDGEEITSRTYSAEYDPNGYNNPDDMSEERAEAIESKMQEIIDAYVDEELTMEAIIEYMETHATQDELDLIEEDYTEEDVVRFYMELIKRTIDNDGEEHEASDPYEVGETDMCCGHELKYSKKTKKYICEVCGTEYEAE